MDQTPDVETITELAKNLSRQELQTLIKKIARRAGVKVTTVAPGTLRFVLSTNLSQDAAYPTLEELRRLPPEERNRRVTLALKRAQNEEYEDLEGYNDSDFDEGNTE